MLILLYKMHKFTILVLRSALLHTNLWECWLQQVINTSKASHFSLKYVFCGMRHAWLHTCFFYMVDVNVRNICWKPKGWKKTQPYPFPCTSRGLSTPSRSVLRAKQWINQTWLVEMYIVYTLPVFIQVWLPLNSPSRKADSLNASWAKS